LALFPDDKMVTAGIARLHVDGGFKITGGAHVGVRGTCGADGDARDGVAFFHVDITNAEHTELRAGGLGGGGRGGDFILVNGGWYLEEVGAGRIFLRMAPTDMLFEARLKAVRTCTRSHGHHRSGHPRHFHAWVAWAFERADGVLVRVRVDDADIVIPRFHRDVVLTAGLGEHIVVVVVIVTTIIIVVVIIIITVELGRMSCS
jgi:hypothetical protein